MKRKESRNWSVCLFPSNKLFIQSKKLSIQVDPLPDESIYSWMLRLSRANLSTFRKTFRYYPSLYYNLVQDYSYSLFEILQEKTCIDEKKLKSLILPNNLKEFILKRIRFCPICFKTDEIPYFRRIWRYRFINACPIHQCLLLDKCPNCRSKIIPRYLDWNEPLYVCYNCKSNMINIKVKKIRRNHFGLMAINSFYYAIYSIKHDNNQSTDYYLYLDSIYKIGIFLTRIFSWRKEILRPRNKINKVKFWFFVYGVTSLLINNIEKLMDIIKRNQSIFHYTVENFPNDLLDTLSHHIGIRNKRKNELYIPISRRDINKAIQNLRMEKETFLFMDILRSMGFKSDILNYKTNIPISDFTDLRSLLFQDIDKEVDYTADFFKIIDEKNKNQEEIENVKIKKRDEKTLNKIADEIIEKLHKIREKIKNSKNGNKYC